VDQEVEDNEGGEGEGGEGEGGEGGETTSREANVMVLAIRAEDLFHIWRNRGIQPGGHVLVYEVLFTLPTDAAWRLVSFFFLSYLTFNLGTPVGPCSNLHTVSVTIITNTHHRNSIFITIVSLME